jgi:hypothetical protein
MEKNCNIQIYKGIIQFLLESTNYTLKNIADLCDTTITNIRSIYCDEILPSTFSSGLKLVRLYETIFYLKPHLDQKQVAKRYNHQ